MKLGNIIYYITKYTGIKYLVDTYHKFKGTKLAINNCYFCLRIVQLFSSEWKITINY